MSQRRNTLALLFDCKNMIYGVILNIKTMNNGKTADYGQAIGPASFSRAIRFNRKKVKIEL
jgi:hypothetical protein